MSLQCSPLSNVRFSTIKLPVLDNSRLGEAIRSESHPNASIVEVVDARLMASAKPERKQGRRKAPGGVPESGVVNLEEELRDGRYRNYLQKHVHFLYALRARIQEPPSGPYCHEDLRWENVDPGYVVTPDPGLKVEDSSSAKRVAYVPWLRVPDFISGEERKRHDVETLFRRTKRDCRNVGDTKDIVRWNSILESARYTPSRSISFVLCSLCTHELPPRSLYTSLSCSYRYECQYGPEDRSHEVLTVTERVVPKKRKYNTPKKKNKKKSCAKQMVTNADSVPHLETEIQVNVGEASGDAGNTTGADGHADPHCQGIRTANHQDTSVINTVDLPAAEAETESVLQNVHSSCTSVRPSDLHTRPRSTRVTAAKEGGSVKRGCVCRFYVKRYFFLPDMAEITYNDTAHVNKDGILVHDKHSIVLARYRFSKHYTSEIRDFVLNLHHAGVPPARILALHIKTVLQQRANGTLQKSRDCFLSEVDIKNIVGKAHKDTFMKNSNDAESVRMWVRENTNIVFYFQETKGKVEGSLTGDNMPFVIGIQTEFQSNCLLQYGHASAVAIDATFGTNDKKVSGLLTVSNSSSFLKLYSFLSPCHCLHPNVVFLGLILDQFPLYTLMVFDNWRNGIPVAYIVTSRSKQVDLSPWLKAIRKRMTDTKPEWKPNAFVVDDAQAEINALR